MEISAGDRLGRFEILGSLGAGGMGEVYRARDLQLHRDVAIKILPQAFSADPDRRRRFEQEARAAGSLNHPNILAVHDVGVHGSSSYIVTELLEGETLRARMGGRALPPRKAIDFAIQIASGLAAGHDRRIVHRDIKPDNLFVTTDGRIKILDFGLAKLIDADDSSNTETITVDGESRGPVMGTAAHMSPEQARGQRIDHRTDIFSLGAVIYEMLTGSSPFRRDTAGDTVNAVLHDDPAPLTGTVTAHPGLERVIFHCLEKKPDERFQSVRDLIFDLEGRAQTSGGSRVTAWRRAAMTRRTRRWTGHSPHLRRRRRSGTARRSGSRRIARPGSSVRPLTDYAGLEEYPAISPDGREVAYTATQGGRRQIFTRLVAGKAGSPPMLITTDDVEHQHPRWMPDGTSLIYFTPAGPGAATGAIYSVSSRGGETRKHLIDSIGGGDVGPNQRLACFRLLNDKIQLVTSTIDGTDISVVGEFPAKHYRYPRWSPDGEWIAYQSGDGLRWDIFVVPSRGGVEPRNITNENYPMRGLAWRADSRTIVYSSFGGTNVPYLPPLALWEIRIDAAKPVRRQLTPDEAWHEQPDVHANGTVSVTRMQMRTSIRSFPIDGTPKENVSNARLLMDFTGQMRTPTANPQSDQFAFLNDTGGHSNIWVTSGRGQSQQITFEDNRSVSIGVPNWSPDGAYIGFVSTEGNIGLQFGLWLVKPDGSGLRQLVAKGLGMAWGPGSDYVYYVETGTSGAIKKVPVTGDPKPVDVPVQDRARNLFGVHESHVFYVKENALVDGRSGFEIRKASLDTGQSTPITSIAAEHVESWQVLNPSLSPDGRWVALLLTQGLTTNIFVVSSDGGAVRQVTDFGGRAVFIVRRVSWSRDGKSIIAAVGDGDADIVLLDPVAGFAPARPKGP